MLCRSRLLLGLSFRRNVNILRNVSTGERDPAPVFFNSEVQQLLKKLTRIDLKKVYRTRRLGSRLQEPEYKFLTTEELTEVMQEAEKQVECKLQMPPVVKLRSDDIEVLSEDFELQGLEDSKFLFTDITYGVNDRERVIVARDPNGVLRKANGEERHRMNETYFPVEGRKIRTPHMFEKPYLQRLLDSAEYEFVLDRACLQFEPDEPLYQDVTATTYSTVEEAQHYSYLRSTRHFGPFAFHLAWNRTIDNLLLDIINEDRLDEAVALVKLYHLVNPDAKSLSCKLEEGKEHDFIQKYVELDSKKRPALELSLQANVQMHQQRAAVDAGIRKAHGQSQ
ncbi:hypothetical protein L9F63_015722 [Diploptera punctata]|uniref:28S ribosomal protein S22, mitochondrial n=1 Tax=Diploptera punctata TaxID=6984 RepID=A0AAD8A4Z2_DIPPU|nr:hypothetical protein L9F63_015722 [Diploptera punctata]